MAKRYTDTDKWKKVRWDGLSMKMKLVWFYLLDTCDHAGIWDANLRRLAFDIGETVTKEEIDEAFTDSIIWLNDAKLYLVGFVEFQYGCVLNPNNTCHSSVLKILASNQIKWAPKGLQRPLEGATLGVKDKDKDKDPDKDLVKDKDKDPAEILKLIRTSLGDDLPY